MRRLKNDTTFSCQLRGHHGGGENMTAHTTVSASARRVSCRQSPISLSPSRQQELVVREFGTLLALK
jgi:hypothetical protein